MGDCDRTGARYGPRDLRVKERPQRLVISAAVELVLRRVKPVEHHDCVTAIHARCPDFANRRNLIFVGAEVLVSVLGAQA